MILFRKTVTDEQFNQNQYPSGDPRNDPRGAYGVNNPQSPNYGQPVESNQYPWQKSGSNQRTPVNNPNRPSSTGYNDGNQNHFLQGSLNPPTSGQTIPNFPYRNPDIVVNNPDPQINRQSTGNQLTPRNYPTSPPQTPLGNFNPSSSGSHYPHNAVPNQPNQYPNVNLYPNQYTPVQQATPPPGPIYPQFMVSVARLCVVSEKELEKCNRMRNAFRAQRLKPELSCVTGHDTIACMEDISQGLADLTMLDAGDIARAGHRFNLIPIIAERYNLRDPSYYVVAVARQVDKETDLLYLKGKKSCHTGFGEAAGWIIPLSFLLFNERMRSYGPCQSAKAASQFFEKSCAPGALSNRYQAVSSSGWDFTNLCDLCHGESFNYCARDSSEPFHGATGSLRCLVDGGGQIAFTRHSAILENAAGRNPSFWSRNLIPDDFELLCRDGSRATFNDYVKCNLGRVSGNAMVTHANRPKEDVDAFINLFMIAQQSFGSKYSDEYTFKMFVSEPTHPDLIFSDATSQLLPVPEVKRHYKPYLGHDFLKALEMVDCSKGHSLKTSHFVSVVTLIMILLKHL